MKNKLGLTFWVLLFFGFSTFSCSAQSSNNDQRIVGTWLSTVIKNGMTFTFTFVFNANGSGTLTQTDLGGAKGEGTFTYGVSVNGEILMKGDDFYSSNRIYFSPDGRTLILEDFNVFGDVVFRKR